MRITEEKDHDVVFICLSTDEAEKLAKQLVIYVGEKINPELVIHHITNQMADLFLEEE